MRIDITEPECGHPVGDPVQSLLAAERVVVRHWYVPLHQTRVHEDLEVVGEARLLQTEVVGHVLQFAMTRRYRPEYGSIAADVGDLRLQGGHDLVVEVAVRIEDGALHGGIDVAIPPERLHILRNPSRHGIEHDLIPGAFGPIELRAFGEGQLPEHYLGGTPPVKRASVFQYLCRHLRDGGTADDQHHMGTFQDGIPYVLYDRREGGVLLTYVLEFIHHDDHLLTPRPRHYLSEGPVPIPVGRRSQVAAEEIGGGPAEINKIPGGGLLPGQKVQGVRVPPHELHEDRGLTRTSPAGYDHERGAGRPELVLQDQHLPVASYEMVRSIPSLNYIFRYNKLKYNYCPKPGKPPRKRCFHDRT